MELKVVIDKKFAFMIFGAILILAGAIYGYAYGGDNPLVMGHSGEEIHVDFNGDTKLLNDALAELSGGTGSGGSDGDFPICIQGQILIFSEGVWTCYGDDKSCEDYGGTSIPDGCLFDSPGIYDYSFPLGISSATVTVVGAGGSGGTRDIGNWNNLGGAGGGAAIKIFRDTANVFNRYVIIVGAGGESTGSNWYHARSGEPGESSSFGNYLKATGGQGGISNYPPRVYAEPGYGIGGDINCKGGGGTQGTYTNAIGGDGECSGGSGGNGGAGGGASLLGGDGNSQIYGAGSRGTGNLDGGDGAVLIEW